MNKENHSITILQDGMVVFMGITLFILITAVSCCMMYVAFLPNPDSLAAFDWGTGLLAMFCGLALPVLFVITPERYFVWYHFTEEGIWYHVLFRRKKMLPYATFPYVMHGKYMHGVYWRDYIVFSNRRLSNSELNRINHVSPSATLIKMRCSAKTCQKLMYILPRKYQGTVSVIQSSLERRRAR